MPYEEYQKNFDKIYLERIEPHIKPLEIERQKKMKDFKATSTPICICCFTLIFCILLPKQGIAAGFLTGAIVTTLVYVIILNSYFGKFSVAIKKKFLPAILHTFGEFYIVNKEVIDFKTIKKYDIFPRATSKTIDDVIVGYHNNLEVVIQESEYTHESGGKNSHTITDFKGIIIRVKFPKNFRGTTVVGPKNTGYREHGNIEKVNLEDPEFMKYYNVLSTDQIEARYILTTSFMERLKNLNGLFSSNGGVPNSGGKKVYCVFDEGNILIFITSYENLFEVFQYNQSMLNKSNYYKIFIQMTAIFDIINELKINTKIGL